MHRKTALFLLLLLVLPWAGQAQGGRKHPPKTFVAMSPDSRYFAVDFFVKRFELGQFNFYNMVKVYHVPTRRYISNLKFISDYEAEWIRFSPDGKKIVLKAGTDYLLLDVRERKRQQRVRKAACIGFAEGGRQFLAQEGKEIRAYWAEDSRPAGVYQGLPAGANADSLWGSEDHAWVMARQGGQIWVWKNGQSQVARRFEASEVRFLPGGSCLVLRYYNRRCVLEVYEPGSFRLLRRVESDLYRSLQDHAYYSGSSISPSGRLVAFCAKRYEEAKGIGVFDWQAGRLVADIDSVALGGMEVERLPTPYVWLGDEALMVMGAGQQGRRVPIGEGETRAYRHIGKADWTVVSPDGAFLASYHSPRSRDALLSQADAPEVAELVDAKFLAFSPNSQYAFFQNRDSTYSLVRTEEIGSGRAKRYDFAKTPYLPGQEDAVAEDADAPPGYAHAYWQEARRLADAPPGTRFRLERKAVLARGDSVGVQFHLMDQEGNVYEDAWADPSVWCRLRVRVPGGDWEEVPQAAWRVQARHHADSLPLALALALDHSGSMGELRARLLQDAIDSVLAAKRPADALSILKFDSRMGIEAPLGTNAQALRKQFRKDGLGQYGGSTAWMQAALDAMGLLAPAGGQYAEKAVVLFTDGQDNSSAPTAAEVAREARARGIRLYAVGFGASVDTLVLRRLATATGGQYYHIYQTPDLLRIFRDVYRRLNSHYTVWLPAGQAGPQEVSVELCLPGGEASLRAVVWGKGQEGGFEAMRELERLPLPEERPGFHKAPEVGDTLLLRVHFLFDRVEFADSASWKAVEEAAAYLRRYPEVRVALCGHTDDQGGDGYNIKLSMDRALAIKGLLVDRGIAADRLEAMGYGASKPVAANDTEAGRAANRRTELLVLPPGRVP